jgi:hypothetical protein
MYGKAWMSEDGNAVVLMRAVGDPGMSIWTMIRAGMLPTSIKLGLPLTASTSILFRCWIRPELIGYARWCLPPHNVQPWKVKILSGKKAQLYYDPAQVPEVVDDQTSFTIVGMGMFIECLDIAARPKGYQVVAVHEAEPNF